MFRKVPKIKDFYEFFFCINTIVSTCGGMVDTMAGDHLKNDEKAAVATYLRHIPEAMVPTFTGVIVACSISGISGACDSVRVRHAGRGLKRRGRGLYPAGLHHDS